MCMKMIEGRVRELDGGALHGPQASISPLILMFVLKIWKESSRFTCFYTNLSFFIFLFHQSTRDSWTLDVLLLFPRPSHHPYPLFLFHLIKWRDYLSQPFQNNPSSHGFKHLKIYIF